MNNQFENRLWKLLEKEKLTDLAQFHERGTFDEVPLFSRESDIEFLLKENTANEILLRFDLKFLRSVIAYEEHVTGYFAAITVWSMSAHPFVPNLFVWCDHAGELKDKLVLDSATTSAGRHIRKLVSKLHLGEKFGVREDTSSLPDATRVFYCATTTAVPRICAFDRISQAGKSGQVTTGSWKSKSPAFLRDGGRISPSFSKI